MSDDNYPSSLNNNNNHNHNNHSSSRCAFALKWNQHQTREVFRTVMKYTYVHTFIHTHIHTSMPPSACMCVSFYFFSFLSYGFRLVHTMTTAMNVDDVITSLFSSLLQLRMWLHENFFSFFSPLLLSHSFWSMLI